MGVAEVAGKLGSLAFLVIGARELSRSDFGAFSYAFAFAGLISSLLIWGFDTVLVRGTSEEPDRLPQFIAETYTWRLIVGLPTFIVIGALGAFTRPTGTSAAALLLVLAAFFVDTTMRTAMAGAEAMQRTGRPAIARLVERVLTAGVGIAALGVGFGLGGYSAAYLAGSIAGGLALALAVRPIGVRADFSKMTRQSFLALGKASIPLGIDGVIGMGLFKIDALLLALLRGDSALAVYAVAYRLLETMLFVAYAVVASVFAVMSAADALARVRVAVERGLAVCAVVYVPFAVASAFRASGILQLLFGAQYAHSAAAPLAWLGLTPLFIAFGNLATVALFACHKVSAAVVASFAALVFNVVLNLVLIPSLGPTGAAVANTTTYLLEAIVLAVLCARVFGLPRIDRALVEAVGAGGAMVLVFLFVHQGTVVDLLIGGAVYGLAWVALSAWFAPQYLNVLMNFLPSRRAADARPAIYWQAPETNAPAAGRGLGVRSLAPIAWRPPLPEE